MENFDQTTENNINKLELTNIFEKLIYEIYEDSKVSLTRSPYLQESLNEYEPSGIIIPTYTQPHYLI